MGGISRAPDNGRIGVRHYDADMHYHQPSFRLRTPSCVSSQPSRAAVFEAIGPCSDAGSVRAMGRPPSIAGWPPGRKNSLF